MKHDTNYDGISVKDAEHQREWNEWFEKHFNEKGEYVEEIDEAIIKKVALRKEAKQNKQSSTNSRLF